MLTTVNAELHFALPALRAAAIAQFLSPTFLPIGSSMILLGPIYRNVPTFTEKRSSVDHPTTLKRNGFKLNHHFALASWLSVLFSENRYPLFRIML
jgi:hypothetical protein